MKIFNRLLFIAVAYYFAGRVGLMFAIPPGYVSPVWPAAGVGLTLLLIWGRKYWPGIFLGSMLLNVEAAVREPGNLLNFDFYFLTIAFAAGAVLRGIAGEWLFRKYANNSFALDKSKDIAALMFFGGPVSCLVSASIGCLTLLYAGIITPESIVFRWYAWWIGDIIGVIGCTPILLLLFEKGNRASVFRKCVVAASLFCVFFLGIYAFWSLSHYENAQDRNLFERKAESITQRLQEDLDNRMDQLSAVKSFVAVSGDIDYARFIHFTRPLLSEKQLTGISWIPRVQGSGRHEFERSIQREGLTNFTIREQLPSGELVPALERQEYFPITYTLPEKTQEKVQGFDIQSETRRRQVMEAARDEGEARLLTPVTLLTEKQGDGFIVYLPIYHGAPLTQQERRKNLRGYVATGFIIQRMLERLSDTMTEEGIRLTLTVSSQVNKEPVPALFTINSGKTSGAPFSPATTKPFEKSFLFAGSVLTMRFTQDSDFIALRHHWTLWALLTGEALLMTLMASFILAMTGRIDTVQQLVGEKTAALADSERQLQLVINHMGDGLIIIDKQGVIELFNPACERIFGYQASNIIGKNINLLMPAAYKNNPNYLWNGTGSNGAGVTGEFKALRESGDVFPIEITVTEMELKNRLLYTVTLRDISERKKTEEARWKMEEELRQSKERFQLAVDASNDGIWDWPDTTRDEMYWSPQWKGLLGYRDDEIIGSDRLLQSLVHPEDAHRVSQAITNCIESNTLFDIEYRLRKKSGEYGWFQGKAVVSTNGALVRMTGSIKDITERKFAETISEQLIKQLTDANAQLEQFAYVASHDMREPLRIVVNFTGLLFKEYGDTLNDEALQYIDIIKRSAKKMEAMVTDLLDYGRLGQEAECLSQIDCNKKLQFAKDALGEAIGATGAIIESQTLPTVLGKPLRFSRLLQNLIGNALKYQQPNNTPVIHIRAEDKGDLWQFSVADNGIGIKPQYLKSIFEPFKRLRNEYEFPGTGIGLTICRKIVEDMGGNIWVESVFGSGSTFFFTLPKHKVTP